MATESKKIAAFPFKTLIWATVVVLSLFLFKPEVKELLNQSEELSLFGINIKTSRTEILILTDSINSYQTHIANLVDVVDSIALQNENEIKKFERLKKKLEKDIAKCPGIEKDTRLLNTEYTRIFQNNTSIKKKTDALKGVKIITNLKASF